MSYEIELAKLAGRGIKAAKGIGTFGQGKSRAKAFANNFSRSFGSGSKQLLQLPPSTAFGNLPVSRT